MNIVVLLCFIFLNGVHLKPDDSLIEGNVSSLENKTRTHVEADLSPGRGDSGVIRIFSPSTFVPRPICYPETFLQNLEAAKLIHVLCKQLGHVTFRSRYKEKYEEERPGVLSTSVQCTGLEAAVSLCPWKSMKTRMCKEVLATSCYSCYNKEVSLNGSVHNPGFPHTYLYSLTCEWAIEIPEELGIELTFEQFALPRSNKHECESFIELTYGNQNTLTSQRLCPADRPEVVRIPFKSVRIRFSSGIYRPKYERVQTHYGFNILFRAALVDTPSNQLLKVILISSVFIFFFIICMCFYCCRRRGNQLNTVPNLPVYPLPPNAPSGEELQSVFEFHRCAMQVPQSEWKKPKDFSIFQSETSSADSYVAKWRNNSALAVTSALAPLGPERRIISIATTPRSVFPNSCRKWSEESVKRIRQLRTRLVARFPSTSCNNNSDVSVFFSTSDRSSYSKLNSEEDLPLDTVTGNEQEIISEVEPNCTNIPSIVIEFVE